MSTSTWLPRGGSGAPASRAADVARVGPRSGATYSRPPPATVRHWGRSKIRSRPWWWQKRTRRWQRRVEHFACRGGPDRGGHRQQVPVAKGRRSSPCRRGTRPACTASTRRSSCIAVVSRLKRRMSASMRQNAGATRCAGCAKSEAKSVPDHSMPAASLRTEKVIVLGVDCDSEFVEERDRASGRCGRCRRGSRCRRARRAVKGHVDRMGVAAEVVVGLEQRDLRALAREQPGAAQTGDAGTDDRDAQAPSLKGSARAAGAGPPRSVLGGGSVDEPRAYARDLCIRRMIVDGFEILGGDPEASDPRVALESAGRCRAPGPRRTSGCRRRVRSRTFRRRA